MQSREPIDAEENEWADSKFYIFAAEKRMGFDHTHMTGSPQSASFQMCKSGFWGRGNRSLASIIVHTCFIDPKQVYGNKAL